MVPGPFCDANRCASRNSPRPRGRNCGCWSCTVHGRLAGNGEPFSGRARHSLDPVGAISVPHDREVGSGSAQASQSTRPLTSGCTDVDGVEMGPGALRRPSEYVEPACLLPGGPFVTYRPANADGARRRLTLFCSPRGPGNCHGGAESVTARSAAQLGRSAAKRCECHRYARLGGPAVAAWRSTDQDQGRSRLASVLLIIRQLGGPG